MASRHRHRAGSIARGHRTPDAATELAWSAIGMRRGRRALAITGGRYLTALGSRQIASVARWCRSLEALRHRDMAAGSVELLSERTLNADDAGCVSAFC